MTERRLGINNYYYPHMLSCHISWPITFWAAVTSPRSSPGVQVSSFRAIIIIIIEPTIVLRSTSSLVGVWMLPSRRWCCLAADSHCTATKDDRERRPVLPVPIVSIDYLFSVAAAVHPFRVLSTCGSCWGSSATRRSRRRRDFRFPSHYICPGIDITSDAIILPSSYN